MKSKILRPWSIDQRIISAMISQPGDKAAYSLSKPALYAQMQESKSKFM